MVNEPLAPRIAERDWSKQHRATTRPAPRTRQIIACGAFSDKGPQRPDNQDAWALPPAYADTHKYGYLFTLADGVGGRLGGSAASRSAANYLQALYYTEGGEADLSTRLRLCIEGVNSLNRLMLGDIAQVGGGLTTLVSVLVDGGHLWVANVGDSRAYLIRRRDGRLVQLTEDHSQQVELEKAGLAEQGDNQFDGVITRAIGLDNQLQVDVYVYEWEPGDCVMLCSDGLLSLTQEQIVDTVFRHPPEEAAQVLVMQAIAQDGSDNTSALVVEWLLPDEPGAGRDAAGFQRYHLFIAFLLGFLAALSLFALLATLGGGAW